MNYEQPTPDEIKQFRAQTGLSQTEFGKMLYSNRRMVQYWEAGQFKMPIATWELANLKLRPLIEMRLKTEQGSTPSASRP